MLLGLSLLSSALYLGESWESQKKKGEPLSRNTSKALFCSYIVPRLERRLAQPRRPSRGRRSTRGRKSTRAPHEHRRSKTLLKPAVGFLGLQNYVLPGVKALPTSHAHDNRTIAAGGSNWRNFMQLARSVPEITGLRKALNIYIIESRNHKHEAGEHVSRQCRIRSMDCSGFHVSLDALGMWLLCRYSSLNLGG